MDGVVEANYGDAFTTNVHGGRNMVIRSLITENGLYIHTTAITNTNPTGSDNFWDNVNLEFYVGGMRFAVNNYGQSPVGVGTDVAVDGSYYSNSIVDGKYNHVIELFIAKDTLGDVWNAERMQINYAWCISGEVAHVIENVNARYDASHWWGQAAIGGCADGDWAYGSGYNRPANLFATVNGLVTTANRDPKDEAIDAVASEKYGDTVVATGNEKKVKVYLQGFVGSDGLYFMFTIKHASKSDVQNAWYLNDNVEFVLGDTWTPITFVDGQLRTSGLISVSAMNVTGEQGNYITTAEIFIPISNPGEEYKVKFGMNGNGFNGWQEGYWGDHYIYVTKDGVSSHNANQINDGVNVEGTLDDDLWKDTTVYEATVNDALVQYQARRGEAGVYVGITVYSAKAWNEATYGDGNDWFYYLNIEFRFGAYGRWDQSVQRAICPWNNGFANCIGAYNIEESDKEGYAYKTTFEIFVANELLGDYSSSEEVPVLIAAVVNTGWGVVTFGDNGLPNTITKTDLVHK